MLPRLLFAAVALCLIGALPDARTAHASQRAAEPDLAAGVAVQRPDTVGPVAARAPGARAARGR